MLKKIISFILLLNYPSFCVEQSEFKQEEEQQVEKQQQEILYKSLVIKFPNSNQLIRFIEDLEDVCENFDYRYQLDEDSGLAMLSFRQPISEDSILNCVNVPGVVKDQFGDDGYLGGNLNYRSFKIAAHIDEQANVNQQQQHAEEDESEDENDEFNDGEDNNVDQLGSIPAA